MDSNTLTLSARGSPLALSARSGSLALSARGGPLALPARGGPLTLGGLRNRYKIPRDRANMMFVTKRVFLITSLAVMTAASVRSVTVYATGDIPGAKGAFKIYTGGAGLILTKNGRTKYSYEERGYGVSMVEITGVDLSFKNKKAYLDFRTRGGTFRAFKSCSDIQSLREDYATHYKENTFMVKNSPQWTIYRKPGRQKTADELAFLIRQEGKQVGIKLAFVGKQVKKEEPKEQEGVSSPGADLDPAAKADERIETHYDDYHRTGAGDGEHKCPESVYGAGLSLPDDYTPKYDDYDAWKETHGLEERRRLMQRLLESEEELSL